MIQRKIEEYYKLKKQHKMISERLDALNKEIKDEMLEKETFQSRVNGLVANLQVKRSKPQPDEVALEQLLADKGLINRCLTVVVDHDAVEMLFINGELTDDDLRSVGAEPKVTMALIVEEIKVDV